MNTGLVFWQNTIGRRSQSVLFFVACPPQIPRGGGRYSLEGTKRLASRTQLYRGCAAAMSRRYRVTDVKKLNIWVFSACGNTIRRLKGNQVQILNDPVTVSGEAGCKMSLCEMHEKAQPTPKIRKSGSLLKIEVHSFRRKRSAAISHNGLVLMYVCFFGRKGRRFLLPEIQLLSGALADERSCCLSR